MKNIKNKIKKNNLLSPYYYSMRDTYYKLSFSDKGFIKKYFKKHLGKELNLKTPTEFSEKLQWLKLYWYDPFAIKCADKYEVRSIIDQKIGSKYLNEIYGVYKSVDEIDIDSLPNSFVMKATHSSGHNFVCEDKNSVNWQEQFKELDRWLNINYFWSTREWVYKDIKPLIICEKYLSEDKNITSLTDYKIYCFNGQPVYCQVIKDRGSGGTIDFFDKEWNHMEFSGLNKKPHSEEKITKPKKYEEMLKLAEKLSQNFPFVRVDFYYVKGNIYFGELTFFPKSGFGSFEPPEWNKKMGDLLELPERNKKNSNL